MNPTVVVERAGFGTTIQDRGRFGFMSLGVSTSGAADDYALGVANRLVGNDDGAAVLETYGSCRLRANGNFYLAVAGATGEIRVGDKGYTSGDRVFVRDSEVIELTTPKIGLRFVIAFRGGINMPAVLRSRSTDTLAGLHSTIIKDGVILALGNDPSTPMLVDHIPMYELRTSLQIWPGPRHEWFGPHGLVALCSQEWQVMSNSDRVGVRLSGTPLVRVRPGELPPEGLVRGAIQVPPDGQPIVMLADHPTTGGYPVIAVVDPVDLSHLAQTQPGTMIRFHY